MNARTQKQFSNTFGEQDLYYRSGVVVTKRANSLKGMNTNADKAQENSHNLPRKDSRFMMQKPLETNGGEYATANPVRSLDKRPQFLASSMQ